jgi:gamma-glutamylcyclotransferase (GGCT)/AIG2-like uncharacterized protein YtfP
VIKDYSEYVDELWSDEHQSFPWWMSDDDISEQKWDFSANYGAKISDANIYTQDMPALARHEFQYLFVYGTLKKGKSNHVHLTKDAEFICQAHSHDTCFTLRETSAGRIPVMLSHFGERRQPEFARVKGELYLVKTKKIAFLDVFEQNGVLYRRIKARFVHKGFSFAAWVYLGVKKTWEEDRSLLWCPKFTAKKDKTFEYYDYTGVDKLAKGKGK